VSFLVRGGHRETIDGDPCECEAPALIVHPPGTTRVLDLLPGDMRALHIEYSPAWLATAWRRWGLAPRSAVLRSSAPCALARSLYREFRAGVAARRASGTVSTAAVEGLLFAAFEASRWAIRIPGERDAPPWLPRVAETIHARFREPLTLESLAACVGVGPPTVGRAFRRSFGCSLREYLTRLRLDYAREALQRGARSLAALADDAGFCDVSYFTRTFRAHTGMTPGQYRSAFGNGAGPTTTKRSVGRAHP
jgi:AraC-like DNA-binding protein